jgi:CBS domain-containing protein
VSELRSFSLARQSLEQEIGDATDRDVRSHMGRIDTIEVKLAMDENPLTVSPTTPLHEAAQTIFEQKVDGLPVVKDGRLAGVITSSDIPRAFLERD